MSNAIKFTEKNGKVHVGVSYGASDKTVSIEVVDTGVGIPEDKWNLVFERFSRRTCRR